ncbi:MAG: hypothetical protein E7773_00960 [Sphingomonas sp.]|uniref:J domain-containing protein n=1 Tax=Sphingomonas sp. TaxID=28214 RepID=UPI0011F70819|nr:J domain-containing protein [Sphingomonas sp.]THD38353.1 MAG: hypothetical protein E7773_00960 [Sphingomonas sp.]
MTAGRQKPAPKPALGPSDPYAVLGLAPGADLTTVRAKRRALLRQVHPDTAGPTPDAAERTHAINQAYAAIAQRIAREIEAAERAASIPMVEIAPAHAWVASPYPMPPRRSGGTTLAMILVFVGLPAMAMTLPGVPGHVAQILRGDDAKADAFARSGLRQVRRLLTPSGFTAPPAPAPAAAPAPVPLDGVAPLDVARAVKQADRIATRDGAAGVVAYSQKCSLRAARHATPAAIDFCAAFDTAADRLDEAATRAAYAKIGADPARLDAVKALVK